jgi:hypothetical protein
VDGASLNSKPTTTRSDVWHSNSSITGVTTTALPQKQQQVGGRRHRSDVLGLRVAPFLPAITVDQEPFYALQGPILFEHDKSSTPSSCQMYSHSNTTSSARRKRDEPCAVCGRPPAWHLMTVQPNPSRPNRPASSSSRANRARRLYVAVRNLRCSLRARPACQPSNMIVESFCHAVDQLLTKSTAEDDVKSAISTSKKRKKRRRSFDQVGGEGPIHGWDEKLVEACTKVRDHLLPRCSSDTPHGGGAGHDDDQQSQLVWAIRTIMACDAIYYRLYYADLTSAAEAPLSIPHPVQYFGGWEDDADGGVVPPTTQKISGSELDEKQKNPPGLFEYDKPPRQERKLEVSHALERLHVMRMQESRILFGRLGAAQQPDWSLLRDWQDSCRDFLCHLYAYATISTDAVQLLKDRLQGHVAVEMGAGTGYLAHLIGNGVVPYDCHPAGSGVDNEYHAATPPFTRVKEGGPLDMDAACSALILCYPPVDNDMAYEALEVFLKASSNEKKRPRQGRPLLLVHIGEFQGLTGTPRFESLLTEKLNCFDRVPCLSWGTDTAEISFWELRHDDARRKKDPLVSCGRCRNRPATIRFRYARTNCYCGMECAKLDEATLRGILPSCFAHLLIWTTAAATEESQHWESLRVESP